MRQRLALLTLGAAMVAALVFPSTANASPATSQTVPSSFTCIAPCSFGFGQDTAGAGEDFASVAALRDGHATGFAAFGGVSSLDPGSPITYQLAGPVVCYQILGPNDTIFVMRADFRKDLAPGAIPTGTTGFTFRVATGALGGGIGTGWVIGPVPTGTSCPPQGGFTGLTPSSIFVVNN